MGRCCASRHPDIKSPADLRGSCVKPGDTKLVVEPPCVGADSCGRVLASIESVHKKLVDGLDIEIGGAGLR